jgi:hypothetical protein
VRGLGDRWRIFVRLVRAIWETGTVPRQMMWVIVVLLPKGGGDFRGIGLLEPFWKVMEIIMDSRLHVVEFHDCLHGFVKGKGCGTAGIEAKLVQQLAFIEQHPLYVIFIDLKKAYDAMDRERCREILVGYGVGPNMLRLILFFWDNALLVCRASGRYGPEFQANRGVTQGGPLSPKLFNIMVDAIVREWLRLVLGERHRRQELARPFDSSWHSSMPMME